MNIKDMIEKYNAMSDEDKLDFEELDFKSSDDIAGLEKKKNDLLGQNKKLRDKVRSMPDIDEKKVEMLDFLENQSIIGLTELEDALSSKSADESSKQEIARLRTALETQKAKSNEYISQLESAKQLLNRTNLIAF